MLNSKGFDLWANDYDKSVNLSEEANEYPFAGYKKVLGTIYDVIKTGNGRRVLDFGFGTGVLLKKLYDEGFPITGVDFSARMIEIAKDKMPGADFLQYDFSMGLPESLGTFDFIVCTYAIHHLDDLQKISFIRKLAGHLAAGGALLIGDVAFATAEELELCKSQNKGEWDNDEIYPVYEVLKKEFPTMAFQQISFCAGVLTLVK